MPKVVAKAVEYIFNVGSVKGVPADTNRDYCIEGASAELDIEENYYIPAPKLKWPDARVSLWEAPPPIYIWFTTLLAILSSELTVKVFAFIAGYAVNALVEYIVEEPAGVTNWKRSVASITIGVNPTYPIA